MAARKPKTPEQQLDLERAAKEMETSIEAMSGNGMSPQQIALLTGIRPERLYKKYKDVMIRGAAKRTNEMAEAAFLMGVGGPERNWRQADASMNKFWLEKLGGPVWAPARDRQEGPDLTRLSVPQLIELEKALRPLARGPVMIDAQIERDAEPRERGGGADEPGAGAQPDGGVGVDLDGSGEVPPLAG
jgi:DNA-binding CsgD family transcriptional regulator